MMNLFIILESGNKIKSELVKYSIDRMDKELQAQIDICDNFIF